jgi:structural maintenance of chromosome 1
MSRRLISLQLEASVSKFQRKITELAEVVNAAEDNIFAAFCHKIKVDHIRDYEERQLKLSQEESEARLRHDTQIARLRHQYDISISNLFITYLMSLS